ncbi:hypothetical protein OAA06_01135 [bacterium]|nr:hypothetical protein [bacterium]
MPLMLNLFGTKPSQKTIEQMLCNDLTPEQTLEVITRFTPEAKLLFTTKVNCKNIGSKTLFIKLNKDKGLSVKLQDKMKKNLNAQKIVILDS